MADFKVGDGIMKMHDRFRYFGSEKQAMARVSPYYLIEPIFIKWKGLISWSAGNISLTSVRQSLHYPFDIVIDRRMRFELGSYQLGQ